MKLVIATPVDGNAVTGQVSAGYATALARVLRDTDAELAPMQLTYSYDICRARNRVAAMVLADIPDATHVLWWDSDVVPGDLRVIAAMLATGYDVVAAPYARKRHPIAWTHAPIDGEDDEVGAVPFGFTITTTACLRRMCGTYCEELGYRDVRDGQWAGPVVGIFNLAYRETGEGRELLSEDYSFCHRWRAIGGKVYLYTGPGSVLSHVGLHAFTGPTREST